MRKQASNIYWNIEAIKIALKQQSYKKICDKRHCRIAAAARQLWNPVRSLQNQTDTWEKGVTTIVAP